MYILIVYDDLMQDSSYFKFNYLKDLLATIRELFKDKELSFEIYYED